MKHSKNIFIAFLIMSPLCVRAQEVRLSNGINLTADGPIQLVLNGMGLTNNGNFKAVNSTVIFTGNSITGSSFIAGNSPVILHNVNIDRTSGDLQLRNSIFINGTLNMVNGNLELNNYSIDLGTSGNIIGERSSARITGTNGGFVRIRADLNALHSINPGNIGLEFNSSDNMGVTVIKRGHLQQLNENGDESIQRYYEIEPAYHAPFTAKVRASYLDVESQNVNPSEIILWSSADAGRNWSALKENNTAGYFSVEGSKASPLRLTYFKQRMSRTSGSFLQLYPNPVRERFTLTFYSNEAKEVKISLFTQAGQLLETKNVNSVEGLNKLEWNVVQYPGGNYQVKFLNQDSGSLRFTKQ